MYWLGVGHHTVFYSSDTDEWYVGSRKTPGLFAKSPAGATEPPICGWSNANTGWEGAVAEDVFFAPKSA
jgi:hypothetical protein